MYMAVIRYRVRGRESNTISDSSDPLDKFDYFSSSYIGQISIDQTETLNIISYISCPYCAHILHIFNPYLTLFLPMPHSYLTVFDS